VGLNDMPSSERIHIGFFGKRNAGKSSVVNAVTGQDLAVISEIKGTTTDPVKKALEILPLGPVVVVDTPGIDDEGQLGNLRVKKAKQVLNRIDIAVLVVDADLGMAKEDRELIKQFSERDVPYIVAYNKADLITPPKSSNENEIYISALNGTNIYELKERIAALKKNAEKERCIVSDLIREGDIIILVTPVDESAPKGRLILPQQQTIREILDSHAISVVVQEQELKSTINNLKTKPRMVVTDSQAFGRVSKDTPPEIPLTSFSILFARYKGLLEAAVKGAAMIDKLKDGDYVLISEGCTHHRQCNDIGTVKITGWLKKYTGKNLNLEFTSGGEFKEDLSKYALVIHCGGCMLTEKEMRYRLKCAKMKDVPMTNYGTAIAHMHGILKRSLELFPDLYAQLD